MARWLGSDPAAEQGGHQAHRGVEAACGEPAKYMEVAKKEYTAKYNNIFLPGDTGSGFEQVKVTCYQKVMPEDGSILFMQLREFQELH
eukprot:4484878-Lingulodinium_polyedra.AAC.1